MIALLSLIFTVHAFPIFPDPFPELYPKLPLLAPWQSAAQVEGHLIANGVTSVPDFIRVMDREMRRRHVPMAFTRSRQFASPAEPRIILYHGSGDFFLAYDARGTKVEMIHLEDRRYVFSEVDFARGRPKFASEAEINECYACHAKGAKSLAEARLIAHPIFDTYPDWPEAYANSDRAGAGQAPWSPAMEKNWNQFRKTIAENPRYALLEDFADESINWIGRITTDLQNKIGEGLLRRTARTVLANSDHERWLPALEAATRSEEAKFRRALPEGFAEPYWRFRLSAGKEMAANSQMYYDDKTERFNHRSGLIGNKQAVLLTSSPFYDKVGVKSLEDENPRLQIGFVLEQMGLSLDLLHFTREPRTFSFIQGKGSIRQLHRHIVAERGKCAGHVQ